MITENYDKYFSCAIEKIPYLTFRKILTRNCLRETFNSYQISNMKKPLFLGLCILLVLASAAQSVDLDRFYFNAAYRDLPRRGLDTSWRTFAVTVETGAMCKMAIKDEYLTQMVNIEGWRKLDRKAHILIRTRLEDVIVEKSQVRERQEILKDKQGKQTGVKNYYAMQLTYTYGAQTTVTDYTGRALDEFPVVDRSIKNTYTSQEYTTKLEAELYFAYNIMNVTSEIMRRVATNTFEDISNRLTTNYGYVQRTVNDFMWILDSRKHPEYDSHRRAFALVKQAMFQMNADEPTDKVREMLKPAIDYFEKVKRMYPSTNKKERKLRYASYYNLAKIYIYLDDPDAAMREATALVMNDFDARDGHMLESAANDLKWLLQQNKVKSRHFPVNLLDFNGPFKSTASKVK
jgi:hypothetical protein